MCGIFGMISTKEKNIAPDVLSGLKKLEYRGYDSAGISLLNRGKIKTLKQVGEIKELEKLVNEKKPKGNVAISHTRWASHGQPSVVNAHPHESKNGIFSVVHNGIIENHHKLREKYLAHTTLVSENDTQIIAQLLEENYAECKTALKTIKKVCEKIEGTYAFCVLCKHEPDKIFCTKKESPLLVSHTEMSCFVASDSVAMLPHTNLHYILENEEYAILNGNNIEFFDKNLKNIIKQPVVVKGDQDQETKLWYPHFMIKEINDIPHELPKLISSLQSAENVLAGFDAGVLQSVEQVIFIACGTAYHAALIGARHLEGLCGIDCRVEIASEFRYGDFVPRRKTLAIFITQSGETADTIAALKMCKRLGVLTLAVVNAPNSTIVHEADVVLQSAVGKETAVASTKAYVGQVATLILFAQAWAQKTGLISAENFNETVAQLQNLLSDSQLISGLEARCLSLAKKYLKSKNIFCIGRQRDYFTAKEAALKLKEITYKPCDAYPSGELKHGTITLVEEGTLVIAFLTDERVAYKTLTAVEEVKTRGAKVLLVSNLPNLVAKEGEEIITVPQTSAELSPLVSIIPIQLLSYYLSWLLGNNPDKPRHLAKSVTVE